MRVSVTDIGAYREATADLLLELSGHADDLGKAQRTLDERLHESEFTAVLAETPHGPQVFREQLLTELAHYSPGARGSSVDLATLIRIHLLSQIDAMWWGRTAPYETDAEVLAATDLVDLDWLRRRGGLGFHYRRQAGTLPSRVVRAVARRVWPDRTPRTAGLRFTRARPETVALLNQVADELVRATPPGTPPLWITSVARSINHQHRLRGLGYPAVLPSAHCVGYAVDIEMAWFRRFGADRVLAALLLARQDRQLANVIDEGQVWHVCVSPAAVVSLRAEFNRYVDG
jgi:hypothetical protein